MDIEARLRAFAAVAREGSFSRAAERLYVSQPALSKHVASLEAELGTQLIIRDRRGATLTPAGQVLADYVLRAEALLANARRALATGAEAQIGTLSLAASGIPGTYLLPGVLARFHDERPAVELDVRLSTSGGSLELVRSHEVEFAVVGGMTVPPELESEPLVEDDVVLVGAPSFGGRRLRPKDLEGLTWVSREEGSATRAAVEAARWQIGLHAVRTLELPSWEAVKLAVASRAGIAAISRFALDLELEAGTLAVLDVQRWRLARTISVITARDVPLTPPAERFLELLRGAFRTEAEAPANSNLPALATSTVGRERELGEITELLAGPARVVTLTGPGGSGKTRLALAAAAGLTVLATSRTVLRLAGEHAYPVEPLSVDDAETLFVERARAVSPRFEPDESVSVVCERLDRLPLAIELAAVRVRTLSPSVLVERLEAALPLLVGGPRDAPDRQRTLRATIEWSYELLEEPERSLFRQLSVFGGSWTRADAEDVCAADETALESLVDHSLLRRETSGPGQTRYAMLETVRA